MACEKEAAQNLLILLFFVFQDFSEIKHFGIKLFPCAIIIEHEQSLVSIILDFEFFIWQCLWLFVKFSIPLDEIEVVLAQKILHVNAVLARIGDVVEGLSTSWSFNFLAFLVVLVFTETDSVIVRDSDANEDFDIRYEGS